MQTDIVYTDTVYTYIVCTTIIYDSYCHFVRKYIYFRAPRQLIAHLGCSCMLMCVRTYYVSGQSGSRKGLRKNSAQALDFLNATYMPCIQKIVFTRRPQGKLRGSGPPELPPRPTLAPFQGRGGAAQQTYLERSCGSHV